MAKDLTLKFKVTDEGTILLDKISQKISGIDKSTKQMSSSLSLIKWDSIVNLGARAIHAGEQIYSLARSIATSANEIQRQAEIMGVSTDVYQKLAYAAKMADVSNEEFAMGMKFLARSIEEAKAGTGNAGQYFKALGIDVDKLSDEDLKLEKMTYRLADAFKSVQDGTGKTDTAIGLLGRSGQKLVPLFNQGSEAMKQFGEEAVKMGSVLGDVALTKGSEAEKTFKQLETTVNALKISLAPAASVVAGFFKGQVDNWTWLIRHIVEGLSGSEVKGMFFKTVDELLAYSKKMAEGTKKIIDPKQFADPEGIKRAQTLLHEWLSGYRIDIDELNQAMSVLGTKSTQGLVAGIKDAENAVSSITVKFIAGKISVLDYANAIKSLTESYKKMAGEDTYKKLDEAMSSYLDKVKQLNEQYPDRGQEYQKALSKAIDEWLRTKEKIEEQDPTYIRANLSKWEEDLREAKRRYDQFAASLPPVSISAAGGGSSGGWGTPPVGGYGGSWDANLSNKLVNIEFTATGMSPKMPLGDALSKLVSKFGGIEELISGLEAEISFDKASISLKEAEKALAKYSKQYNDFYAIMSRQWTKPEVRMFEGKGYTRDEFYEMMQNAKDMVDLFKKEQALSFFQGVGSFQFGTAYVPRTGFAMVHEGEKIISKNQTTNMGGVVINISGGGDPKRVADEIAKVLKYKRSFQLRESLNG